jgi:hypothetical protein
MKAGHRFVDFHIYIVSNGTKRIDQQGDRAHMKQVNHKLTIRIGNQNPIQTESIVKPGKQAKSPITNPVTNHTSDHSNPNRAITELHKEDGKSVNTAITAIKVQAHDTINHEQAIRLPNTSSPKNSTFTSQSDEDPRRKEANTKPKEEDAKSEEEKNVIHKPLSLIEQVRERKKQAAAEQKQAVAANEDTNKNSNKNSKLSGELIHSIQSIPLLQRVQTEKSIPKPNSSTYQTYQNGSYDTNYSTSTRKNVNKPGNGASFLTKKGKASGVAVLLGIVIGVLLGFGAYYLFTDLAKPTGATVGLNGTNGDNQTNSTASNNKPGSKSDTQTSNSGTSSSVASSFGSNTVLGPGGAASGSTVYLYQIGLFSDSSSLDKQVQTLKNHGILSFQRGSGPYQLLAGGASSKAGLDGMNKRLQGASVEYYMKPFVVPNIPDKLSDVSDTAAKNLHDALQVEWDTVNQWITEGKADTNNSVAQRVKDAMQTLPAKKSQAVKDIEASLDDMQRISDAGSAASDTDKAVQQSYWVGKFYTEFAQGIADLQS